MFDSGAQELLLNARYFEVEDENQVSVVRSVTGKSRSFYVRPGKVELRPLSIEGGNFLAVDMAHVEADHEIPVHGLIGFQQMIHFDWVVDYAQGRIHFFERTLKSDFSVLEVVQLQYLGHLPRFSVEIAGQSYRFLLDTGCEMVFLDRSFREALSGELSGMFSERMASGSPTEQEMESGTLSGFRIGALRLGPSPITFGDLTMMKRAMGDFDGIIGYPLLGAYPGLVSWQSKRLWLLDPAQSLS